MNEIYESWTYEKSRPSHMYPTSDSHGRLDTHCTDTLWRKSTVPNTWAWPSTTSSVGMSISPTSGPRQIEPWDSSNGISVDVSPRLSSWLTRQWFGQHWSMPAQCGTPTIRSTLGLLKGFNGGRPGLSQKITGTAPQAAWPPWYRI